MLLWSHQINWNEMLIGPGTYYCASRHQHHVVKVYSFLATCSFDFCSSSISQVVHFCVVEIGYNFLVGFLSFQLFVSDQYFSKSRIYLMAFVSHTQRSSLSAFRNMREKIVAFSRKLKNIFFNEMKFGRRCNRIQNSCDVITRSLYLLNYDRTFPWKFLSFFLSKIHTWQISTQLPQHPLQTQMFLSLFLTHWLI